MLRKSYIFFEADTSAEREEGTSFQDWKGMIVCDSMGNRGSWPWLSQCLQSGKTWEGHDKKVCRGCRSPDLRCSSGAQTWQADLHPRNHGGYNIGGSQLKLKTGGLSLTLEFCTKSLGAFEWLPRVREREMPKDWNGLVFYQSGNRSSVLDMILFLKNNVLLFAQLSL